MRKAVRPVVDITYAAAVHAVSFAESPAIAEKQYTTQELMNAAPLITTKLLLDGIRQPARTVQAADDTKKAFFHLNSG